MDPNQHKNELSCKLIEDYDTNHFISIEQESNFNYLYNKEKKKCEIEILNLDESNGHISNIKQNPKIDTFLEKEKKYNIKAKIGNSKLIHQYTLTFQEDFLSFDNTNEFSLNYDDIIGASIIKDENENGVISLNSPIYLNACPKVVIKSMSYFCIKPTSNLIKRETFQITIFSEKDDQEQLLNIFNNIGLYNKPMINEPLKKKLLVFVNPTSGKGKSMAKWLEAERVFNLSHVEIELITTQYYRHAYNYVLSLEKKKVYYKYHFSMMELFV